MGQHSRTNEPKCSWRGGGEVGIEGRETGRDGRKREWRESRGRLGTWWEAGEKKRGGERRRGKE